MKKTAQELHDEAFAGPRGPRSAEYKAGVLEALKFRLGESGRMHCPHKAGTPQADAWFAGTDEGHRLARDGVASWLPPSV